MDTFGKLIGTSIDALVRWVVVPVTGVIPRLVSSGVAFVLYGALWVGFGAALVTNPGALDEAWQSIAQLPLPVQAVVWLLFLPVMAGLWVWGTDWPVLIRLVVVIGIAAWNLLVFVPRSEGTPQSQPVV
ncbi:MAG TPA: hypothetical protein VFU17_13365 [Candidatus Limnocylindrales bacterium]|nr:hypothetical protein [Candidatus Limnocylindrales bacterium]